MWATRMKSWLPWSSQDSLDLDEMRLGPKILDESWKVNDTGQSLLRTSNVFVAAGKFSTLFTLSLLLEYFKKLSMCWGPQSGKWFPNHSEFFYSSVSLLTKCGQELVGVSWTSDLCSRKFFELYSSGPGKGIQH